MIINQKTIPTLDKPIQPLLSSIIMSAEKDNIKLPVYMDGVISWRKGLYISRFNYIIYVIFLVILSIGFIVSILFLTKILHKLITNIDLYFSDTSAYLIISFSSIFIIIIILDLYFVPVLKHDEDILINSEIFNMYNNSYSWIVRLFLEQNLFAIIAQIYKNIQLNKIQYDQKTCLIYNNDEDKFYVLNKDKRIPIKFKD